MNDLDFKIGRGILKIGNRLNNMRVADLKEKELTPGQSDTLIFFAQKRGATVSDLKTHLQISHQAARNIVERLKIKGLLYTSVSNEDGRANSVNLTESGEKMYIRLKDKGSRVGDELLEGFSEDEKKLLYEFITRIGDNI